MITIKQKRCKPSQETKDEFGEKLDVLKKGMPCPKPKNKMKVYNGFPTDLNLQAGAAFKKCYCQTSIKGVYAPMFPAGYQEEKEHVVVTRNKQRTLSGSYAAGLAVAPKKNAPILHGVKKLVAFNLPKDPDAPEEGRIFLAHLLNVSDPDKQTCHPSCLMAFLKFVDGKFLLLDDDETDVTRYVLSVDSASTSGYTIPNDKHLSHSYKESEEEKGTFIVPNPAIHLIDVELEQLRRKLSVNTQDGVFSAEAFSEPEKPFYTYGDNGSPAGDLLLRAMADILARKMGINDDDLPGAVAVLVNDEDFVKSYWPRRYHKSVRSWDTEPHPIQIIVKRTPDTDEHQRWEAALALFLSKVDEYRAGMNVLVTSDAHRWALFTGLFSLLKEEDGRWLCPESNEEACKHLMISLKISVSAEPPETNRRIWYSPHQGQIHPKKGTTAYPRWQDPKTLSVGFRVVDKNGNESFVTVGHGEGFFEMEEPANEDDSEKEELRRLRKRVRELTTLVRDGDLAKRQRTDSE